MSAATTRFVGRSDVRNAIEETLAIHRCATLVGPPGVGKTRLAQEIVRSKLPHAPEGGLWRCDLVDARSIDGLCSVLAATLRVPLGPDDGERSAGERMGEALRRLGPAWVILDACEGVRSILAELLPVWLEAAPAIRFIATSRCPLGMVGERAMAVEPLDCSSVDAPGMELFLDRATLVRHGYDPQGDELAAALEVVQRLDGLPLAIELAASRLRALGTRQILHHLEQRFRLLRAVDPEDRRQVTLRAAIDGSWQLLSWYQRMALAQCSVFRGGFDLEAAERVVSLGDDAPWTLDVIQELIGHSLVMISDEGGALRYQLFESVRCFAAEQLSDRDRTEARHRATYLDLADRLRNGALEGPSLEAASREIENLHEVFLWSLSTEGEADVALQVALGFVPLFVERGPRSALLRFLDAAIDRGGSLELLGRALARRAGLLRGLGRAAEALDDAFRAQEIAEAIGDASLDALASRTLADTFAALGDVGAARRFFRRALEQSDRACDYVEEAHAELGLAELARSRDQLPEAREALERARRHLPRVGATARVELLARLGRLALDLGEMATSRRDLERALASLEARGRTGASTEAAVRLGLGLHALERRAVDGARDHLALAVQQFQGVGDVRGEGLARMLVAQCGELEGDESAREQLRRARALLAQRGDPTLEALVHAQRARLEAELDDVEDARRHLDEARRRAGDPCWPVLQACEGHVELAEARLADGEGDADRARRHRDTARAVAASIGGASHDALTRVALVRLDEALREVDTTPSFGPPARPSVIPARLDALVVSSSGRAFCVPGGEPVDLSTRTAPRRILGRLAQAREETPGVPLATEDLLSVGWPGERLLPEAGKTRVYTAIATLRRMGLKPFLLRRDDGYLLDPEVPLRRD